ncbi:MAG: hypothetical protein Q4G60_13110, partial [bacterium]|nr:hypothetical protein [bacterium]
MQEYRENDILREISKKSRKVRKRKPRRMKIAWKRVLSVVVVIAIVLCLMPLTGTQSAQAADYRSIYFGTSGVLGYHDGTYDKIYLGGGATPHEWRVLDTTANGSTGTSGRALFVESMTSYGKVYYSDASDTYQWSGSIPRQQAQSAYNAYFSATDKEIVLPTTKGISEAEKAYSTSSALNGDYLYLLSREEYSNSTYGFDVVSGDTWTNRDKAAWTRTGWKSNKSGVGNAYILGSKGDFTASAIAGSEGPLEDLYFGMNMNGDASAVLFTTNSNVKSQGLDGTELKATTSSRNSNWKITQLKSDITLKTTGLAYVGADKKVQADSYSITKPDGITGTMTLSAMMTEGAYGEADAQILYYSKISTSNGSFNFTLPTEYSANANYHIYLIPEVQNTGYAVDYAGMPVEVDITDHTEYTISAAANPAVGGTVTESVTVKAGENATLTATPAVGYKFLGWSKQGVTDPVYVSTTPSFTITNVTASANYVADFEQSSFLISVNASPEAGGFVSGGGTVAAGGSTTLKAVAEDGYTFSKWLKDGTQVSTDASYTIDNVTADASYTAVFTKAINYVTLTMFPVGAGTVYIGTIPYSGDKILQKMGTSSTMMVEHSSTSNDTVWLHGMVRWFDSESEGYRFGNLVKVSDPSWTMNSYSEVDKAKYTANDLYYRWRSYGVSNSNGIKGDSTFYIRLKLGNKSDYSMGVATAVRPAGAGVTSGDKDGNVAFDTTLNATANPGYVFDHWEWMESGSTSGDNAALRTSTEKSMKVSGTGYQVYTAVFRKATYDVVATPSPIDGGAVSGLGTYEYGTTANVKATPANGYTFSKWTWKDAKGDSHESTDQNLAIENIQASYNLTAVFKKTNHNVTVSATPVGTDYVNKASVTVGTSINETTATLTSVTSTVADGGSAVLKATPYTAGSATDMYQFKQWVANDGKVYTDNPLTVANITEDKSYVAVFEKQ